MGLSLSDIKTIIVSGFKSAFMPFHIKQSYLRSVTEELERFLPDGRIQPQRSRESSRRGSEAWSPRARTPGGPANNAPSNTASVDLCPDSTPVTSVERAITSGAN
jgi:adenosine deaminase